MLFSVKKLGCVYYYYYYTDKQTYTNKLLHHITKHRQYLDAVTPPNKHRALRLANQGILKPNSLLGCIAGICFQQ